MGITHYLETGSQDPFYNLAFEEYVLLTRTAGDYLLLWQNENTIVVGQNQNTEYAYEPIPFRRLFTDVFTAKKRNRA